MIRIPGISDHDRPEFASITLSAAAFLFVVSRLRREHAGIIRLVGKYHPSRPLNTCRVSNILVAEQLLRASSQLARTDSINRGREQLHAHGALRVSASAA
jgi:hypothetical protein